jgi:hypothetical protein
LVGVFVKKHCHIVVGIKFVSVCVHDLLNVLVKRICHDQHFVKFDARALKNYSPEVVLTVFLGGLMGSVISSLFAIPDFIMFMWICLVSVIHGGWFRLAR